MKCLPQVSFWSPHNSSPGAAGNTHCLTNESATRDTRSREYSMPAWPMPEWTVVSQLCYRQRQSPTTTIYIHPGYPLQQGHHGYPQSTPRVRFWEPKSDTTNMNDTHHHCSSTLMRKKIWTGSCYIARCASCYESEWHFTCSLKNLSSNEIPPSLTIQSWNTCLYTLPVLLQKSFLFNEGGWMANYETQVEQEAAYPIPISLYNSYRTVRHEKRYQE